MAHERKCSKQTLRLLAALADGAEEWKHGYNLSTCTGLKSGSLYPILMRLEDRGLLESQWQPSTHPGRPARHMYRLTPQGAVFSRNELAPSNQELRRTPRLARA